MDTLEEVQQGTDEYAAKARGLLARMENFDLYFSLRLAYLIFSSSEQLSINLQSENITIQEAMSGATLLVSRLKALRKEEEFDALYDQCLRGSQGLTDRPELPRQRKRPKRLDDGASHHMYETPKDRYRHAYFESFELALGEIENRFNQSDLQFIKKIEELLLNAANEQSTNVTEDIKKYLQPEVDCSRLSVQLAMIPNMISSVFSSNPITRVTNIRTIADAMNTSDIYKSMLCEVDKLLKIFFTFPVTSATAERSFSSLRRIKTFIRSSMSHCHLFLLYIHVNKTDTLDLIQIAKEFVCVNARRVQYFGKF